MVWMTVGMVLVRVLEGILVMVGEFFRMERGGEANLIVGVDAYGEMVMVEVNFGCVGQNPTAVVC